MPHNRSDTDLLSRHPSHNYQQKFQSRNTSLQLPLHMAWLKQPAIIPCKHKPWPTPTFLGRHTSTLSKHHHILAVQFSKSDATYPRHTTTFLKAYSTAQPPIPRAASLRHTGLHNTRGGKDRRMLGQSRVCCLCPPSRPAPRTGPPSAGPAPNRALNTAAGAAEGATTS